MPKFMRIAMACVCFASFLSSTFISLNSIFNACSSVFISANSSAFSMHTEIPNFPARAVRPLRCVYWSGFSGK